MGVSIIFVGGRGREGKGEWVGMIVGGGGETKWKMEMVNDIYLI